MTRTCASIVGMPLCLSSHSTRSFADFPLQNSSPSQSEGPAELKKLLDKLRGRPKSVGNSRMTRNCASYNDKLLFSPTHLARSPAVKMPHIFSPSQPVGHLRLLRPC